MQFIGLICGILAAILFGFRWVIALIITAWAMAASGFFAGMCIGIVMYIFMGIFRWVLLGVGAYLYGNKRSTHASRSSKNRG